MRSSSLKRASRHARRWARTPEPRRDDLSRLPEKLVGTSVGGDRTVDDANRSPRATWWAATGCIAPCASRHIGYRGQAYPESFALADVRLQGNAPVDEIVLFYAPAALAVLVPLPGDVHRIVAPVTDPPPVTAQFVQRLLDTRAVGPRWLDVVGDPIWASHFRIHHRVADRCYGPLLAGNGPSTRTAAPSIRARTSGQPTGHGTGAAREQHSVAGF